MDSGLRRAAPAAALTSAALAVALGPQALLLPLAGLVVLALLRWPVVLLGLFVYIPYFKSEPHIAALPGDPTAALGLLVVLACAHRLLAGRVRRPPAWFVVPVVVLGVLLGLSLLWTPSPEYGLEKVVKYFSATLVCALAPFALVESRRDLLLLCGLIAAGAVFVAALAPFVEPTVAEGITTEYGTQGRYSVGGQNFPARMLCTGALVLLLLPSVTRSRWRHAGPVLGIGVFVIALGFGARGPIMAFLLTVVAIGLLSVLRAPSQLAAVVLGVAIAGSVLTAVDLPGQASQRLAQVMTEPGTVVRTDPRYPLYDRAIELIPERPLSGLGAGGFEQAGSFLSPARQTLRYPHNLFLELAVEVGVLGPLILALAVGAGLVAVIFRLVSAPPGRAPHLLTLVLALFLVNLLAAQVSGDVNDNRTVFLFLGLLWIAAAPDVLVDGRHGGGASPRSPAPQPEEPAWPPTGRPMLLVHGWQGG